MICKYGKDIDMRHINRDVHNLKEMIRKVKDQSIQSLVQFNPAGEEYTCNICHESNYDIFLNIHGYYYCECKNCKSVFLANIPDVKKLYEGNPDTTVDMYVDKDLFYKRVKMIAEPKVNFILNVAKQLNIDVRSWLDIGCGTGEVLYILNKLGYNAMGIESDLREVNFAKQEKKLNIIEGYVDVQEENLEIAQAIQEASVISFFNVLEHINEPDRFIDYIYQNMSDKTLLIFEVPKHPSLASFVNLTAKENIYRHMVPPIHLQIFSDEGIGLLLKEKFELLATWGFGQGFFDILTNAMLVSDIGNTKLYNQILNSSNKIQSLIDEANLSDQMLYVAQKK
ncbi:class I SAM-dependent methyltransferase [Aminipila sp.]|uniref:class I SAM-dependent methyltransferase n=1 Tax=Aminipila sp. TaxID=2060095 RepID=UPI00289B97FA|nr:class I SAM-dependent methyltransferase [Aminipila sp.]